MPQEAQKSPSDAPADDSGTETPPDTQGPEKGAEGSESSSESFSREYVIQLRNESRENRLKAQRADFLATEVRRLSIREATRGILTDPESLSWSEDYADTETGLPDHDALRQAAQALAKERPWLSRPRGPLPGQGEHSTAPEGLSLSALLRS